MHSFDSSTATPHHCSTAAQKHRSTAVQQHCVGYATQQHRSSSRNVEGVRA